MRSNKRPGQDPHGARVFSRKSGVAKRALRPESSLGRLNAERFQFLLLHGSVKLEFLSEVSLKLPIAQRVPDPAKELSHLMDLLVPQDHCRIDPRRAPRRQPGAQKRGRRSASSVLQEHQHGQRFSEFYRTRAVRRVVTSVVNYGRQELGNEIRSDLSVPTQT